MVSSGFSAFSPWSPRAYPQSPRQPHSLQHFKLPRYHQPLQAFCPISQHALPSLGCHPINQQTDPLWGFRAQGLGSCLRFHVVVSAGCPGNSAPHYYYFFIWPISVSNSEDFRTIALWGESFVALGIWEQITVSCAEKLFKPNIF